MEEQLISFETAKLAKEKNYPQYECPSFLLVDFAETNTSRINPDNLKKGDLIGYYIPNKTINAPAQSLLQKWLREKHHLFIEIYMFDPARTDYFSVRIIRNKRYDLNLQYPYKSYEEALESGLKEALKLI